MRAAALCGVHWHPHPRQGTLCGMIIETTELMPRLRPPHMCCHRCVVCEVEGMATVERHHCSVDLCCRIKSHKGVHICIEHQVPRYVSPKSTSSKWWYVSPSRTPSIPLDVRTKIKEILNDNPFDARKKMIEILEEHGLTYKKKIGNPASNRYGTGIDPSHVQALLDKFFTPKPRGT